MNMKSVHLLCNVNEHLDPCKRQQQQTGGGWIHLAEKRTHLLAVINKEMYLWFL